MASTSTSARPLRTGERRLVALLGLPTFALALALTVVTTYLPVVARGVLGSTVFIGMIVGLEGVMALWVPLAAGSWSDRLKTRWGGRLPFVVAGAPVLVLMLAALAFVRTPWLIAAAMAVLFAAYFTVYEPYRALYPDLVPEPVEGRAQSAQALFRGGGTAVALLGGGLALGLSEALPFLATAAVVAVTITGFVVALVRRRPERQSDRPPRGARDQVRHLLGLLRRKPALRAFLLANALWELSLGALKTFVVLYITQGLGFGVTTAAAVVGGGSIFVLVAAATSGPLADRMGRLAVLRGALVVYGLGLLVPFLVPVPLVVAVVAPLVGLGGGAVMALPYAVLTPLMPGEDHGALTGLYTFSRGIGTSLGPLLAGVAVSLGSGLFTATDGYQAVWGVCAVAVLGSLPVVARLRRLAAD
jgi:Na+/melibiose symporter-like transporter